MGVWKCSPILPSVPGLTEPHLTRERLEVNSSLVPVRVTVVVFAPTEYDEDSIVPYL